MRKIQGYVFIPYFDDFAPIFGKKMQTTRSDGDFENFSSNNLSPFDTKEQAISSVKEFLSKRKCEKADISKLFLEVAESRQEIDLFKKRTNLIVIRDESDFQIRALYGPYVEGKPHVYPLPGALLAFNGYKQFKRTKTDLSPFEKALYQAKEINRQGQDPATIAYFRMVYLLTINKEK